MKCPACEAKHPHLVEMEDFDGVPFSQVKVSNRVFEIAAHIPWYTFRSFTRLAKRSGISKSTMSRVAAGQTAHPDYVTVLRIAAGLEKQAKRPIPSQEVFSVDGNYPTRSVCELMGCSGCAFTVRPLAESQAPS